MTGLSWVGYFYARRKNGSDEISGGNQIGSDTFQNGSDIIRYPTVILSPGKVSKKIKIGFGTMGMECMALVAMDAMSWK